MDVIGDLLRAGLLTQIGEGEDRVEMVRSATVSLARQFTLDLRTSLPHALVAGVDEATPVTAAPMVAADAALLDEWSTYRNVFPEPPAEVLRAMLVGAVAQAAEQDFSLLAAGWYTLRTALETLPVSRWQAPLNALASLWDDAAWRKVTESWSPIPASSTVRMPSIENYEEQRIPVKSDARTKAQEFQDAANFQQFASALQSSYAEHVDTMLEASEFLAALAYKKSNEALRAFASDLGTKLRHSLAVHETAIESMRLRSDLLWWRETSFSPTRRVGYSELSAAEAAVVAALDLHLLMPAVAPLAAEHMLSELVAKACDSAVVTLSELSAVSIDAMPESPGLSPSLVLDAVQGGEATPLLGADAKVDTGRAAVLLFRDLQARRLSVASSEGS